MIKQYTQSHTALGSEIIFSLVTADSTAHIDTMFHDLWRATYMFERQFSRFLPTSELSHLNQNAGTKQHVTHGMVNVLQAAKQLSEDTEGLYNPFILPALQAAGYIHSHVAGHEKDRVDDHSRKTVTTIDRLEIGDDWIRMPYGTALDIGGCGKGYLADTLADMIEHRVAGYWLSLGGDIIIGGTDATQSGWTVHIQSLEDASKDIGSFSSRPNERIALATSGTTVHKGKHAGTQWHHIIDPRTRKPAQTDTQLATVCHTSALSADVLASCAVILGRTTALPFLEKHHATDAVLQHTTHIKTRLGNRIDLA